MKSALACSVLAFLSLVAEAQDEQPIHVLRVIYVYSVQNQEVNWHTSDETRVQAIRNVSRTNSQITLSEFTAKDKFQVTVIVPFEKNFIYKVRGNDPRFRVWVDIQRKGYAKIEVLKGDK